MISLREKRLNIDKNYISVYYLWAMLIFSFYILGVQGEKYYTIFAIHPFLYYHTLLEFFSIVIYFIIFTITYYTYQKNKRLRLLVFSSTFFMVGFIDFFHTMNYEGMPGFFIHSSATTATTYWIIGRLIFTIGLLIAALIPIHKKTEQNRNYYVLGSAVAVSLIFYVVNYRIEWIPPMFVEGKGMTPLKILLEYVIMLLTAVAIFFYLQDYKKTKNIVFIKIVEGLSFAIFAEIAFTLYVNVHDSYNMLGHIYKVISCYLIFRGIFIYNLDTPYIKLQKAREIIENYAKNLKILVEERTEELEKANKEIMKELEYATRIQQSLLPPKNFELQGITFLSEYIPCENMSGDFYDVYKIDDENIGVYIADVAGHGPSAAMMTIFTERVIKSKTTENIGVGNLSCEKALLEFYKEFNDANFPDEMHIAALHGIYNTKSQIFTYCSAGLNTTPFLVSRERELEALQESKGFPICNLGDLYTPEFQQAKVQLQKGDKIVLYTDGLVENFKENTLVRQETLENILKDHREASGIQLREIISRGIALEIKNSSIDDDITLLIMEI